MNWAGLRSVWSAMVLLTAVGVLTCQFKRQLRFESAGRRLEWSQPAMSDPRRSTASNEVDTQPFKSTGRPVRC
jgi:hypothetical protein